MSKRLKEEDSMKLNRIGKSTNLLFNIIFIICSMVALLGFGISFLISQPPQKIHDQSPDRVGKGFRMSNFLEFSAIPISIIVLIVGFNYSAVLSFLSLYSKQLHLEKAAGVFFFFFFF
jgi:hypothetical protein